MFLRLVLGSRSRFTKSRGPLIAGGVPDATDMLVTSQRWRHSRGRLAYHSLELLVSKSIASEVHASHKIRRSGPITWCTMCGHTFQTAALRCVKFAQELSF